jgi:hypothetical protein
MIKRTEKQKKTMWAPALLLLTVSIVSLTAFVTGALANPSAPSAKERIFAQALVENTLAKHSGLEGVGLATIPPEGHDCVTIADTDAKELGDKCDKGEVAVMKTGKPTVEKEGDGYDVTLPLHVSGETIGIIGMDFKLDQEEAGLLDRAKAIAKEIEDQIPSKAKLFEPAK